jgi:hypothetical protein
MYLVVSVGNTDNKLTQQEWYQFTSDVNDEVMQCGKTHFYGGPPNWWKYQNVAWIVELEVSVVEFTSRITKVRERYNQDSAFILYGEGRFV